MIKDKCERCAEAYGHPAACPELIKNPATKSDALTIWQRGKTDAEMGLVAKTSDQANPVYMLGRKMYDMEIKGLMPKRRQPRAIRVPLKSEPRMAAVGARIVP